MYGRTVRGPINILQELWTQEIDEQEVKSSYQYMLDLLERLNDTLKRTKEQLELSQNEAEEIFRQENKG